MFRVIAQGGAQFVDGGIDPMAGINKNIPAPEPLNDFAAGHQTAPMLDEKNQQLHRILLELYDLLPTSQFVATQVQLKFVKLDDFGAQPRPPQLVFGGV